MHDREAVSIVRRMALGFAVAVALWLVLVGPEYAWTFARVQALSFALGVAEGFNATAR